MNAQAFYKPCPIEPSRSWVARLLRWSLGIGTAGWAAYGLFAFAFADLGVIPKPVQSWMVIAGSALIVIGAEANTIPTCIAVFSKVGTERIHWLDYAAFAASVMGTLAGVLITFSSRQVLLGDTGWRAFALRAGPLVAGAMTALDFYGSGIELGLFKRDYERAMASWLEEKSAWDLSQTSEQEADIALLLPFVCETCGRAFDTRQGLNGHGKAHTGERSNGHSKEPVIAGREVK